MKVKTAYSEQKEISAIIQDIKKQIGDFDAKLIMFFASTAIDPQAISYEMQKGFPNVQTFGCSTSGELITGKMLDESLVAMAFSEEIVGDCKVEVLTHIKSNDKQVDTAFKSFENHYGMPTSDLSPDDYFGIVLIDGLSLQEEVINERIGDLTNVTFIGGSAGDDLAFNQTYIFANGKTYTEAAVLTLVKSNSKFEFLKTQSFSSTGKKAVVTKADESTRKVVEINQKPATAAYAELVGVPEAEVGNSLFSHPVGLVFEDDFFVRSPQRIDDQSIYFYCAIKEGMELDLLESQNIVKHTQEAINNKLKEMKSVSAIINFNCILRTLELKKKNQTTAYGEIFSDVPTVGFSTYGESYIGHINQTSTILLFE